MTSKTVDTELEELLKDEIALAQTHSDFLVKAGYLTIKTKDAKLIPLIPNKAQIALVDKIQELRKQGKPVRIWVLKARQEGISTVTEGLIYSIVSQTENINALILADEKEHSSNLFEMFKLYHEQLALQYPHLTPALKKSNEKKLEFAEKHSQIIISTAENTESARSHTFHLVHLSEVAFFRNLMAVMVGLNNCVPDLPNTMIIGETTANGINQFYDEWTRAIEGKSDWIPFFIPWFWMDEYAMPLQNGQLYPLSGIKFTADTTESLFIAEEEQLQRDFNLSPEQINWRRWKIANSCAGDVVKFKQEFPCCWQEAFQMSGSNFFSSKGLEQQNPSRPIAVGEIFEENLKFEFRSLPSGRIKIYEHPVKSEQYVVSADASEAVGKDEASIIVLNKRLNKTAAVVNGQYAPAELAQMCISIGNYYNKAMIAPENKGYGYMVCQLIYAKYGNIYRRRITKTGTAEQTEELGYNTNSITRPEYLALMADEVGLNSTKLLDADLINQCHTFIINPKNNKPEAALNKQDGLVIARAIAGKVRQEFPYNPQYGGVSSSLAARVAEVKRIKNGGFGFGK